MNHLHHLESYPPLENEDTDMYIPVEETAPLQPEVSEQLDQDADKLFLDNLQAMMEDDGQSETGASIDMAAFTATAVAPDTLGAFPMPPEETNDVEGDNNKIINWHLSRLGVALDSIKDSIDDDSSAREWLEFKMLVAAGKNLSFDVSKWDYINDLESEVEPFVEARGGDMHRG